MLDQWRRGVEGRRALAVEIIKEFIDTRQIESAIDRTRNAIGYTRMAKRDQDVCKQMFSQLRRISEHWVKIDEVTRFRFLSGFIPYSALAKCAVDRME